jgi:hypothetical protein
MARQICIEYAGAVKRAHGEAEAERLLGEERSTPGYFLERRWRSGERCVMRADLQHSSAGG